MRSRGVSLVSAWLKHYQGLRLRTIGEMLNTTEETAKNTLFRATQKLRGSLSDLR